MYSKKIIKWSLGLFFLHFILIGSAQQILFDKGIRAGELQLFPELSNPNNFYYLPDKVVVASHPDGKPIFSFIRYVRNSSTATGGQTITEANDAGGVLHVLVNLSVPPDMVRDAQRELQRINGGGQIMGPIVYKSGKIAVISSIVGTDGEMTRKVIGLGAAPILENEKAAVSVLLTKQGADILWATFQTPTPDLSFAFEMDARGYLSPKNVKIEANFEQIYSHKAFEAAAVSPVFAAEIKVAFDDLVNKGAIKVTQIGDDAELNKMRETAYNQLVNLIFDKVGGQSLNDLNQIMPGQKSMLDRATDMLNSARTEAKADNEKIEKSEKEKAEHQAQVREGARTAMDSVYKSRGIAYAPTSKPSSSSPQDAKATPRVPIPSFAVTASFVFKEVKRRGTYFIDLNKYTEDQRTFPFAENVGNILSKCPTCFFNVNLDDPLYKQREVQIRLVDVNASDFDKYINSVEVIMHKLHQNGEETEGNILIDKIAFNEKGNNFSMIYGWKGDEDRAKWLEYEYKTRWIFAGGYSIESDWQKQISAVIPLSPPLIKKDVYVEVDPELVNTEGVRGVEVKLSYKQGDHEDTRLVNFKVNDNVLSKSTELLLPKNVDDYNYEVTWFLKGKQPLKIPKTPYNYGSLYLDSLTH
ncbi:MAG: hypothetical protein ABJB16_00090 [Saprospiraceae bacterium]